jgi:hypothetical protein
MLGIEPEHAIPIDNPARPANSLPFPPGASQAHQHAFPDDVPLELRHGRQNMKDHLAHWRGCIDRFIQADELHPERSELLEGEHQVPRAAGESVEPRDYDGVEFPEFRIAHQLIERRPAVFGSGDADVDEFDDCSELAPAGVIT